MKKVIQLLFLSLLYVQIAIAQESEYSRVDGTLRIMSYNIRNAKGMDLKTDYGRVANIMNTLAPDIIAVQELDSATNRSNKVDVLTELSSLTGMYGTYGVAINYDGGKYGVGILSKEPPLGYKNIALPGREEARTMLIAEFKNYVLICTHWSLNQEDRVASITIANDMTKQYDKPIFMAGDFNATPDSEEVKLLSETWKVLSNIKVNTFPADFPNRCIDYIFEYSSSNYISTKLQGGVLEESMASDHRPLFIDLKM